MYIYTTSAFEQEAAKLDPNLERRLTELRTRAPDVHSPHMLNFEIMRPYWKLRRGRTRLIARLQYVRVGQEQALCLCLLAAFDRNDNDYKQFVVDPASYGKRALDHRLDEAELRAWLEKEIQTTPLVRSSLPPTMQIWLNHPEWGSHIEDQVIYESTEWVQTSRSIDFGTYIASYYDIIFEIVELHNPEEGTHHTQYGKRLWLCTGKLRAGMADRHVLYSMLKAAPTDNTPERSIIFLIEAFDHIPTDSEVQAIKKKYAILETTEAVHLDDVVSLARRSYPFYLLYDFDIWSALQSERGVEHDRSVNLALSSEEEAILHSASTPHENSQPPLPMFINGRAGSGKSTMLMYLFADYCHRQAKNPNTEGKLLFLTYNQRLLEVAKQGVHSILRLHPRFVGDRDEGADVPAMTTFFQPFQTFLLGLLDPADRQQFIDEQRITFHRFKRLYLGEPLKQETPDDPQQRANLLEERQLCLKLPQARKWSPEFCWYAIRTFIKGYSSDGVLTVDDYQEIPRRERVIPEDVFQEIYATIWEQWYQPMTSGEEATCWDDLDLVRVVLKNQQFKPEYVVIFCDESQDFTRLELQLLLRLSMFSQYDLSNHYSFSIPFVFAGDPFQTLNPTGFRWKSLQAAFHSEVITNLDPVGQSNLGINYQELRFNYRSSPAIVRFINLIQWWRRILFKFDEIQPQQCWQFDEFPGPQKFILGEHIPSDALFRINIQNTIIIVPCEEGQEAFYVQQDAVLSKVLNLVSADEPPANVMSAVAAKGLEFEKVILYNFGEACPEHVWSQNHDQMGHQMEAEYFFNKLYVAASRATKRLFVIDTQNGNQRFWQYANQQQHVKPVAAMLAQSKEAELYNQNWQHNIQAIETGDPEHVSEMEEKHPESVAEEFKSQGLNDSNADLMRRAMKYYISLGSTEARLCEAWALRFDERFAEAGNIFLRIGRRKEAKECFWEGMCWDDLVDWYAQYEPTSKDSAHVMATFLCANPADQTSIDTFTSFLIGFLSENRHSMDLLSRQWKTAIQAYRTRIEELLAKPSPGIALEDWNRYARALQAFGDMGYPNLFETAGQCFYRANQFGTAIDCWEKSGGAATQKREYCLAQVEEKGLPQGLPWLSKLPDIDERNERIIAAWNNTGASWKDAGQLWLEHIILALQSKRERLSALWEHPAEQARTRYRELSQTAIEQEIDSLGQKVHELQWAEFDHFLTSGSGQELKDYVEKLDRLPDHYRWSGIERLMRYLMHQQRWFDVLQAEKRYFSWYGHEKEKMFLYYDIVRELAYRDMLPEKLHSKDVTEAELTTSNIKRVDRMQVEEIIMNQVLQSPDWRSYLTPGEVGAALERSGGFGASLRFYEQIESDHGVNRDERDFVRLRWIVVKRRQIEYYRARYVDKREEDAQKLMRRASEELRYRAKRWNIDPNISLPEYPQLERRIVKGLPSGTQFQQLSAGNRRFTVDTIEVTIFVRMGKVRIMSMESSEQIEVDLKAYTVKADDTDQVSIHIDSDGQKQLFTNTQQGYCGTLYQGTQPRLELQLNGSTDVISIEL